MMTNTGGPGSRSRWWLRVLLGILCTVAVVGGLFILAMAKSGAL
jgi:hypothetical protein